MSSAVPLAASLPMIMVVYASLPVSSIKELIAQAKAKPNTLQASGAKVD
jgi:tripartite-type tricarboxylate transporter receptor subunit TctC